MGQPGKSLSYGAGTPAFDMEAVPGDRGVEILLSIPYESLTFVRAGEQFLAAAQFTARVQDAGSGTLLVDVAWPESTTVATYDETRSEGTLLITRTLDVPPGDHTLIVTLEDLATGRTESRYQPLRVRDTADRRPGFGRLLLQSRLPGGTLAPVIPFHVSEGLPGFQAAATLYAVPRDARLVIRFSLEQFRINQQAAAPPQAYSLLGGMDEPRKILLDIADTVRARTDTLRSLPRNPSIAWHLNDLRPGLYRISFNAAMSSRGDAPDTTLTVKRILSIKPAGFPRPTTLHQLIEAMVYIAKRDEMRQLNGAKSEREAHAVFDSLWLSFCHSASGASQLIRRYYTRVEEANRQFTDIKEGWKTDRGMIYVVLGPPGEIMNNLDQQTWYYDLPGSMGTGAFSFRRMVVGDGQSALMTYNLIRSIQYERLWDLIIARWRECEAY